MSVVCEVSIGELFDKITILEIKSERIAEGARLANVVRELTALNGVLETQPFTRFQIADLVTELKSINERLWMIEDQIRAKEASSSFDDEFIQLARSVYFTNDERSRLKREINERLGSELIEEKSYSQY